MYLIEIRNGMFSTKRIKEHLKECGFRYRKSSKYRGYWEKETEDHLEWQKWKRYCFFRYKCYVYEKELHTRGNSYRTDYFRTHKPTVSGRYHCAYCGRFLSKDALAVDHLIPVQKAKSSGFWQWVLRATRIQNVNSPKNLVGACQRCNSKKGAKASFWVLRGFLGQFFLFWLLVWGLLLFGLCFLFSYYRGEFAELIRFFLGFLGVSI